MSLRALFACLLLLVAATPARAADAEPAAVCSGLPADERAECIRRSREEAPDAPSKERVTDPAPDEGDDDGDDDSGGTAPGDGAASDCGTGSPCLAAPMALLGCEMCTPACKLGGTIGGVTGGVLGFVGGAAIGWFFLTQDGDPIDQRLGEVASVGLIGAIGLGAAGLVIGAGTGWLVGTFSPGEEPAKRSPKKKAPVKKRTKR